jgi:transcriptional regulator with XRE-family HTH domain
MKHSSAGAWPARHLLLTQRLRDRRAELGLTQQQVVGRLARCGVRTTNRALSGLEHGAGVDVAKLPELAIALDCTVTYLIGLTDDPHRWEPDVREPEAATRRGPPPLANRSPKPAARQSLIIGGAVPDRGLHLGMDGEPAGD